jgi:hypothetical protein
MKETKQIKIKLEKHEVKIVRFANRRKFFCEICQTESQFFTVSQMSMLLEISELNVFRLAVEGKFHLLETNEGKLMLCGQGIIGGM